MKNHFFTCKIYLSLCLLFFLNRAEGQVWIFGDSCRIDFVNGSAIVGKSNSSGQISTVLQTPTSFFYAYSPNKIFTSSNQGRIFNNNGILISFPVLIKSHGRFDTMILIPKPGDSTIAYLFHQWTASSILTLYSSTINLYGNFGVGSMITTNTPLLQADISGGSVNVLRHGNGRDWWLYVRQCNSVTWVPTNLWYRYLIDPQGIHGPYMQNIGQTSYSNIDQLIFSPDGTKAVYLTAQGLFDLFEIDRCSGLFTSHQIVVQKLPLTPPLPPAIDFTRIGEFSSNGRYFYTMAFYGGAPDTSYLLQFDMLDTNIAFSRKLIYKMPPNIQGAYFYPQELRRAPDNKIYLSIYSASYFYPFCDSCGFHPTTMNLSVINSPDSSGLSCNFTPFSFYLGGNRNNCCLPDMPNYNIGVAVGSGCDTLVATGMGYEFIEEKNRIQCWPNPASVSVNIRWGGIEKVKQVSLISNAGKIVLSMPWLSEFDVMEIPIQFLSSGLYVVELQLTSGEKFRKKLMVMNE